MLVDSRTVLEAGTGRHAAVLSTSREQAGPLNSPFVDMQQLDRLRRDIGDRHLEVQHSLGWGGCGVVYKGKRALLYLDCDNQADDSRNLFNPIQPLGGLEYSC